MVEQNNDGEKKPFAFESEDQFTEAVSKVIGSHVTKRFESFENRLTKQLNDSFAKFTPPSKEKESDETSEKLTLKKLEEKFEARIAKAEKERDTERAVNRDKTLRAALTDTFAKSGMPVTAQKLAISHLINEKKAFLSEDGEPTFVGEYQGETMPLHEGVANWIKNEGKELIPQKQGAGMRPIKTTQTSSTTGASEADMDANIFRLINERRSQGL